MCQENIHALEHENCALSHNFEHLNQSKHQLMEEVTLINQKEKEAVVALNHENQRIEKVHKIHVKLLAVRFIEETLQRVLNR